MRSSSSNSARDEVLARVFPRYRLADAPGGLSGGSCIIDDGVRPLVLRCANSPAGRSSQLRRHYRLLGRLPPGLAPRPVWYAPGWMATEYIAGEVGDALPASRELAAALHRLHRQRRFGWRVSLRPLLEYYWQQCDPARRTPRWLRLLRRLRRQGEPSPLRLAPLHMDIHGGNIVRGAQGLSLIDWEYAGDGDVALELAAIAVDDDAARRALIADYAALARIAPEALAWQVRRWRPWVALLMAGWYEYRWRQTGDRQFSALADDAWRRLYN